MVAVGCILAGEGDGGAAAVTAALEIAATLPSVAAATMLLV